MERKQFVELEVSVKYPPTPLIPTPNSPPDFNILPFESQERTCSSTFMLPSPHSCLNGALSIPCSAVANADFSHQGAFSPFPTGLGQQCHHGATEECEEGHAEQTTKDTDSIETQTLETKTQSPVLAIRSSPLGSLPYKDEGFYSLSCPESHIFTAEISSLDNMPLSPMGKDIFKHISFTICFCLFFENLLHCTLNCCRHFLLPTTLPDTFQVSLPLSCLKFVTTECCQCQLYVCDVQGHAVEHC